MSGSVVLVVRPVAVTYRAPRAAPGRLPQPRTPPDMVAAVCGSVRPGLALGSCLGFNPTVDDQVTLMGDLVFPEEGVNPIIEQLAGGGVEVTALRNHMLKGELRLFFMHFWGVVEPEELAMELKGTSNNTKWPLAFRAYRSPRWLPSAGNQPAFGKPP